MNENKFLPLKPLLSALQHKSVYACLRRESGKSWNTFYPIIRQKDHGVQAQEHGHEPQVKMRLTGSSD